MSVKLTLDLPLNVAVAICNNDYDESRLASYVVNAVNNLAPKPPSSTACDFTDSETVFTDTGLSTPPATSGDGSHTMVDSKILPPTSPSAAATGEEEILTKSFFIDIEHHDSYGQHKALYTVPARNDMTIGDIKQWLEFETHVKVAEQRILFNGRCLSSNLTLQSVCSADLDRQANLT